MFSVVFLLSVLCITVQARTLQASPFVLKELILSASDCFKEVLTQGDAEIGISGIDPVAIDSFVIDFGRFNRADLIDGELKISGFNGRGMSSWEFERLLEDIIVDPVGYNLRVTILLSRVVISGEYNGTVRFLSQYDVFGDGKFSFSITDAEIAMTIDIGLLGGIHLSQFYVSDVAIAYITGDITGLMNDEDLSGLVSDFINKELESIFNENNESAARYIEEWVYALAGHIEDDGIQNDVVRAIVNKCLPLFA